jgi:uncharacterized protein YrrD
MQFKENADVYTLDDNKVGEVERVVLDPTRHDITHIVVRKGFLFTEDKVVPIDMVESATEERVTLQKMNDLDSLPDFEEEQYVQMTAEVPGYPSRQGYARPYYWYPAPGFAWWGAQPYPVGARPDYTVETWRNIPEGTVPLKKGAEVIAADDEHVGDVERIFANPQQERATHLLISKGLLMKKKKVVPTTWIKHVTEDQVYLAVNSDFIERLPEYAASA